jgi:hypothetical protein
MSKLRFDGRGAGLGLRLGGDANSPTDYTIICQCEGELGPLGRFPPRNERNEPDESGFRQATCERCAHTTIVKDCKIVAVIPPAVMHEMLRRKAEKLAQGNEEARLAFARDVAGRQR